ncbi:helix-turn-helix domain-containing protein [Pedobacter nutrimenti]|uniref:Putative Tic20 family protein n=1 Tax=Pedobacter nutrimenti TaxID=1241337 RepID=A0A318UF71_9SPHI|nr:helix-turn-helix domain-containing protein [Pedobacter nutrimenti]PYF75074.1 putative Tic20 family protein [Pedobacter nutrimenti]
MPSSKLAVYRRKKGLTQEQLAELSGVTTRTIQRIEKGAVVPHIQTLKMLASCLDVETELLMDAPEGNSDPKEKTKPSSVIPLFHLLALIGLGLPILNIILPFVLWLLKKDENPDSDLQAKQVLNFHLTMTILFFPSIVLMIYYFPVGFPLTVLIYAFMVLMTLINLFRSVNLQQVKYPFSYTFFKI